MGRKHKRNVPAETDTFTFSPAEVSASQASSAHANIQHIEGGRTVRQMAVVAAPEEVVGRDFVDIRDLLGDTDDVRNLQDSEEVINQYIEGPGCQRRNQKDRQYATKVSSAYPFHAQANSWWQVHDQVLQTWIKDGHRETALDELLRLEGWQGQERGICPTCPPEQPGVPTVRCDDCWTDHVLCQACCVWKHAIASSKGE